MTDAQLLLAIEALIDESRRRSWMEAVFLLEMVLLEATEKAYDTPTLPSQVLDSPSSVTR